MQYTYKNTWNDKLNGLKEKHNVIAELCEGKKLAYIDIPMHFNVGDQLIYAGTEAFFKANNLNVIYRAFDKNVSLKKLDECDVILLHGGGNFGDIYPQHQDLREKVLKHCKDKRVIQLPQTIHFSSQVELEKSAKVFKGHNDVHIFVRDTKSLDIAKEFTDNVGLMPDMAHSLHPIVDLREVESTEIVDYKILNLRRVDVEKVDVKTDISKPSFDWINIITPWDVIHQSWIERTHTLPMFSNRSINSWKHHSDSLVFRSINHFSSFNVVYTDRLHGFILSYLLGKNIKLMDNSYGKNLGYYNEWIKDDALIEVIDNA
ncbi:polysaccharide pyruvyl transferase family protein [Vibrio sp. TRT 21S02]|uniref:polysaccharide pyruvyl transferase family protein n=1 Tax=Vibrio sp. TRT 21S02 TaxID=3418507 RepID=UPI003CE711C1